MSLEEVVLGASLLGATMICVGRSGPWILGRKVRCAQSMSGLLLWSHGCPRMRSWGPRSVDVEVARGLVATEGDGVVANLGAWAHAAVCKRDTPMGVFLGLE